MIITRRHLSRRTFLRGAGAVIGLPLLDAMVPALGWAQGTTRPAPLRLGFVYVPNGMVMANWKPAQQGRDFAFTPILKPLEPFREHTLVLSSLMTHFGNRLQDGAGDHARAAGSFLTGCHVRESGSNLETGVSADQVAAQAIGQQTRLPSLELGLEDDRTVGLCDANYSCAYTTCISWRTPSTPLPPLPNPRHVFERLFGQVETGNLAPAAAARRAQYRQSILDGAIEETQRLTSTVGPADRRKLDEYLTSIREIETRIQRATERPVSRPSSFAPPPGIPADYTEHARLMYELMALAYQADITRVATMMVGRESSIRSYEQIGIPESHHQLSHHGNKPNNLAKLTKLQTFHVGLFANFIEKLKSMQEGEGTVLDRCMILYSAGIADSNRHTHENLPAVIMGKGMGVAGRHIDFGRNTPVTNVLLAMLDRMGVRPGRLGDSTGVAEL